MISASKDRLRLEAEAFGRGIEQADYEQHYAGRATVDEDLPDILAAQQIPANRLGGVASEAREAKSITERNAGTEGAQAGGGEDENERATKRSSEGLQGRKDLRVLTTR